VADTPRCSSRQGDAFVEKRRSCTLVIGCGKGFKGVLQGFGLQPTSDRLAAVGRSACCMMVASADCVTAPICSCGLPAAVAAAAAMRARIALAAGPARRRAREARHAACTPGACE